jgi:hypothetical protein
MFFMSTIIFFQYVHNKSSQGRLYTVEVKYMNFSDEERKIKRASKMGANEDILHVSKNDDGYDLRDAGELGAKQPFDENGNA